MWYDIYFSTLKYKIIIRILYKYQIKKEKELFGIHEGPYHYGIL